jgi:hypothetical protein
LSKRCQFIRTKERVWVPSPGSWLEGWARHRWLERHFKSEQISVASCELWAELYFDNDVFVLIENPDRTVSETLLKSKKSKKRKKT